MLATKLHRSRLSYASGRKKSLVPTKDEPQLPGAQLRRVVGVFLSFVERFIILVQKQFATVRFVVVS